MMINQKENKTPQVIYINNKTVTSLTNMIFQTINSEKYFCSQDILSGQTERFCFTGRTFL